MSQAMRDVRGCDFLRVCFGRLLVKVANLPELREFVTRVTRPAKKKEEGLGGIVQLLLLLSTTTTTYNN